MHDFPIHDLLIREFGASSRKEDEKSHDRPVCTSLEQEYDALYNGVGVRDLSQHESIIALSGADTLDFLNRITTNEVIGLKPGQAVRTIFTNENGRILDHVTLFHYAANLFSLGSGLYKKKLTEWIDKYLIMDDVTVESKDGAFVVLEIIGPGTEKFLQTLAANNGIDHKPMHISEISIGGINCTIITMDPAAAIPRYRLIAESGRARKIFKSILDALPEHRGHWIGYSAYSAFRIEHGLPSAPFELNDSYNPHEAGIIPDVSFTKGCFIGQEVIARLDTYDKIQKHLRGVLFNSEPLPDSPLKLFTHDGKSAGDITSFSYSPGLKRFAGLAYIKKNYAEAGAGLLAKSENDVSYEVSVSNFPISMI
jgi:folate-binding protein YgfZ